MKIEQPDERDICYAYDVNTLESKVGGKYQINAPFSSQVPRFYDNYQEKNLIQQYLA